MYAVVQMKSMQKLLETKGAHLPPQPQVLASIVGSHSRLGSITECLAKALPTFQVPGRILLIKFPPRVSEASAVSSPLRLSFLCRQASCQITSYMFMFFCYTVNAQKMKACVQTALLALAVNTTEGMCLGVRSFGPTLCCSLCAEYERDN